MSVLLIKFHILQMVSETHSIYYNEILNWLKKKREFCLFNINSKYSCIMEMKLFPYILKSVYYKKQIATRECCINVRW